MSIGDIEPSEGLCTPPCFGIGRMQKKTCVWALRASSRINCHPLAYLNIAIRSTLLLVGRILSSPNRVLPLLTIVSHRACAEQGCICSQTSH